MRLYNLNSNSVLELEYELEKQTIDQQDSVKRIQKEQQMLPKL